MANQHFFQPLLPGFHSHLTIPVAFFLKYIKGRYEQKKTELRSDASKKIWEVKIDGRRLTNGWKEFALSHDLQIGDIVVFRQEKDLSFHVTMLGPSCCEIQYGSCLDKENNSEKIQEVSKKRSREEVSSSIDRSCFVANVSSASLHYDLLYLPKSFVRANGIVIGSGEIVLMNENGRRSWTLSLRQKQSCGTFYMRGGWRSFCGANGLRARDIVTFRLSQRGGTFVLRSLSFKEPEEEETIEVMSLSTEPECDEETNTGKIQMKKKPRREIESSSLDPSCFEANVSPATLQYDRLNLPQSFVRANGLDTRCGEIVLMNEKGKSWRSKLKGKDSLHRVTYIHGGWTSFCVANGLRAGDIVTFKLIQRGGTLALWFLSSKESEEEANEEPESEEEINIGKIQRKKNPRRETESSSLDPSCFVANVLPSTLRYDILYLPTKFVRENGVDDTRSREIVLMNEKGRSWTLKLRQKPSCGSFYIRGGWRSFCHANGLEVGSFFTFKLIQKGRTQVLLLSRKEPKEEECSETNEVESLSTESDGESSQEEKKISQECSIRKRLIWNASSSPSQNRFVTLALTPYSINRSILRLPVPFTKMNGIKEDTKMTMLDKHGVKWPVKLRSENNKHKRIRLLGSWKDFLEANCVKTNDSIKLELIWEDSSCVLKFCSKVKLSV